MIPINVLLQRAQYMSIEDLESHMREREAEVKRLRAEQGMLKRYWDRAQGTGSGEPGQQIWHGFGGAGLNLDGVSGWRRKLIRFLVGVK